MGRIKRELRFNKRETWHIVAMALIFGLILSFRKWGESTFNVNAGLENLAIYSIVAFFALLVHYTGQKYYGIRKGFGIEIEANWVALGIGVFVTFLFNGLLFFLAPGWTNIETKLRQRIGKWRHRPYLREYGYTIQSGIYTNLGFAGLFALIPHPMAQIAVNVNLLLAVFALVPAPKFGGFHIFIASFYQYAFIVSFTLTYAVLLIYTNLAYALIFALIAGLIGFFYIFSKE